MRSRFRMRKRSPLQQLLLQQRDGSTSIFPRRSTATISITIPFSKTRHHGLLVAGAVEGLIGETLRDTVESCIPTVEARQDDVSIPLKLAGWAGIFAADLLEK